MKPDASRPLCFFVLTVLNVLVIVACRSTPPPSTPVRETVVVEWLATVVVTPPAQVLTVEVTRIVEVALTPTIDVSTRLVPRPKATRGPPATPAYFQPYPFGDRTGIPEVDAVAREVLTRNVSALRERLLFQPWECGQPGRPFLPTCRDDELPGPLVEAFSYAYCESLGTRDETLVMSLLDELVARATGVSAVKRNTADGSYSIVFTTVENSLAIAVLLQDANISWILLGCVYSPAEKLAALSGDIILPPFSHSEP